MGSIGRRLEALEARTPATKPYKTPRYLERHFHALDNARRLSADLEPLPDLEYTREDYDDDLDTLEHTIPASRDDPGWQTGKARAFLDDWERHIRERLKRGVPK